MTVDAQVRDDADRLEATYNAMLAHYRAGEDQAALDALESLFSLAPEASFYLEHYYYYKINIGFRNKSYEEILPVCEQAVRVFPRYAPIWFLQGRTLWEMHRHGPARTAFVRALKLDPAHGPSAYELAKIFHLRGRAPAAKAMARRAQALGVTGPLLDDIIADRRRPRAAAATGAAPWRMPPVAVPKTCRGVLLVIGSSYCGSTLLNLILGSHPKIAGGGELHWLVNTSIGERAKEGRCAYCGDACRFWTPTRRDDIHVANLYDAAATALRKPIVCDTSKMPDWSRFMARYTPAPRVRVLMVKHPLRHVASYVEKARRIRRLAPMADIDRILRELASLYDQARAEAVDLVLRYEDLVADPRAAVTPLLARFELSHDAAMDRWRTTPHHDIGGNAGPRSQINPKRRPVGGFLQRKYDRQDIFVDDSFAAVLTPAQIETIIAHPLARAICDEFGYEPRLKPAGDKLDKPLSPRDGAQRLRRAPQPLTGPFETDHGHRFIARLELLPQHLYLASAHDSERRPKRSRLQLLENGRRLGPAHVEHQEIEDLGEGRFSHWHEVLYFSSSDNTDPNTNGRTYAVSLSKPWWRRLGG